MDINKINGNEIIDFLNSLDMDSDKEAGEFIGVTGGAIQYACLKSKNNKCKNYIFKYETK